MSEPTIKLVVKGRTAEMTVSEAREMLGQLKAVFGEAQGVPIVIREPAIIPDRKLTTTPVDDPTPWLPKIWCGPVACGGGQPDYSTLVRN